MTLPVINLKFKLRGFFRLQVFDSEGKLTKDSGKFENLITDQGLNQMGASPYGGSFGIRYINAYSSVGTGNTPPTFADTQLTSFLAQWPTGVIGVEGTSSSSYTAGPPPYWSQIWKYTYPTGTAAGNLAEVGVGVWLTGDPQPELFSHALIVDGGGSPTTITVLSTEVLVLTYELRVYPNTTDTAYSFPLNGSTTESGIFRPSNITTVPAYYRDMSNSNGEVIFNLYNGTIGSNSASPSGTSSPAFNGHAGTSISTLAYSSGSYFRGYIASWNTTTPRLNVSAMRVGTNLGAWQFSVSPSINITTGFSFQMQANVSWARF